MTSLLTVTALSSSSELSTAVNEVPWVLVYFLFALGLLTGLMKDNESFKETFTLRNILKAVFWLPLVVLLLGVFVLAILSEAYEKMIGLLKRWKHSKA